MSNLYHGDCLNILPTLEENSVDAIVTDPPYGLSFMGKDWDHGVPGEAFWREALRVAKPGAHLLAFGGSRTVHRLTCAIEDAGWEIRDTIMWVYGSGFPKSHDVSKAIDREAGAENIIGAKPDRWTGKGNSLNFSTDRLQTECKITAPATPLARQWDGWGTALKPAHEPIIMARKPFPGTVAQNVTTWGTGAINVDGGRVGTEDVLSFGSRQLGDGIKYGKCNPTTEGEQNPNGRWPANLIHDGSEEVLACFPVTGASNTRQPTGKPMFPTSGCAVVWNANSVMDTMQRGHDDNGGSAARFFYCAKASKADRDEGLEGFEERQQRTTYDKRVRDMHGNDSGRSRTNHHPTVKPTDLMRYLVRLVTPPNGIVLDPFMGSGSTGKAAILEGFGFVGIEKEQEYIDIAGARIGAAVDAYPLFANKVLTWR